MATGFSFKVEGVDKLLTLFKRLPKQAQTELSSELKLTAGEVRDGAKASTPVDESRLRSSISVKKVSITEYDVVVQTFYAPYMEFGTKSNTSIPAGLESYAAQFKGSSGQPKSDPLKALEGWVKRKGLVGFNPKTQRRSNSLSTQQKIKALAWVIWRHIKKYGVRPHPFFFKQLPKAETNLKQRAANVIKKII